MISPVGIFIADEVISTNNVSVSEGTDLSLV
jgi:hypothetical protein